MQKSLAQIKATSGRDITSQVDNNTLVYGETGSGTGGAFNFMAPINNALANYRIIKNIENVTNIDVLPNGETNCVYSQLVDSSIGGTKPTDVANGILTTYIWANQDFAKQVFYEFASKNRMFIRYRNNGAWEDWEQLVTKSDFVKSEAFISDGGLLRKWNGIVYLSSVAWVKSASVIPEGFRPVVGVYVPCVNGNGEPLTVLIGEDGQISRFSGGALTENILINATWLT